MPSVFDMVATPGKPATPSGASTFDKKVEAALVSALVAGVTGFVMAKFGLFKLIPDTTQGALRIGSEVALAALAGDALNILFSDV